MATNYGIEIRLESVPELQKKCAFLSSNQVQRRRKDIHSLFLEEGKLKPDLQSKRMDIYDAAPDEARQFLLSLNILHDEKVWVIWCSTETGISIRFRDFVQYYDDLWYPSSDDVWVTEESLSWLLEFDHEEIVTFAVR